MDVPSSCHWQSIPRVTALGRSHGYHSVREGIVRAINGTRGDLCGKHLSWASPKKIVERFYLNELLVSLQPHRGIGNVEIGGSEARLFPGSWLFEAIGTVDCLLNPT